MSNTNDPRTEAPGHTDAWGDRTFNIVDHPLMKYTVRHMIHRIIIHRQRLALFRLKNMPLGLIQAEQDIVDLLEAVLAAKQKFLNRCMGINQDGSNEPNG